jgi:hypothetical protein
MLRVAGFDGSRNVLEAQLLDAIAEALAKMPESPQKRQLKTKADTYRRTIDQFRSSRVSPAQCEALDDMVLGLHGKLLEVLRRNSLDLTPGPLAVDMEDIDTGDARDSGVDFADDDEPPPSSTPVARVKLRSGRTGPDKR